MDRAYTSRLVERHLASSIARQISGLISETDREAIVSKFELKRDAESEFNGCVDSVVRRLLRQ